ncbi:MAG: translation initiation factor IF-6 [Candidatus Methanofastidiosia archaeon]
MIERLSFFGSSFIGIFALATDEICLCRNDLERTKKIEEVLGCEVLKTTVGSSDFLGVLCAGNSSGILCPYFTLKEEIETVKDYVDIKRFPSKYTALGNLILANDRGCLASPILKSKKKFISDVLDVEVEFAKIAKHHTVGSCGIATNKVAYLHPEATLGEKERVSEILKVPVELVTVNAGVFYLSSSILANSNGVITGELTTGYELSRIEDAFLG